MVRMVYAVYAASMDWFLDMMELSEKEFMEIANRHITPPHVFDKSQIKNGKKLWDQDLWDKVK